MYKAGERVIWQTKKAKHETYGVFQWMATKSRAVILVDPETMEDEGLRTVSLSTLRPWKLDPTNAERRAKHGPRSWLERTLDSLRAVFHRS